MSSFTGRSREGCVGILITVELRGQGVLPTWAICTGNSAAAVVTQAAAAFPAQGAWIAAATMRKGGERVGKRKRDRFSPAEQPVCMGSLGVFSGAPFFLSLSSKPLWGHRVVRKTTQGEGIIIPFAPQCIAGYRAAAMACRGQQKTLLAMINLAPPQRQHLRLVSHSRWPGYITESSVHWARCYTHRVVKRSCPREHWKFKSALLFITNGMTPRQCSD